LCTDAAIKKGKKKSSRVQNLSIMSTPTYMTESKDSITSKVQALGRIDYLVNNAGYSILAACEHIT
jgi:NADP-dependent 3-hydroxy acid dehydrogenase YdfG